MVTAPSFRPPPIVAADSPEWTHEDCVQYEVAREAITALMAFRSQWIFDEQQKPAPDLETIAGWRAERSQLAAQLQGLDVRDKDTVKRICREYGPEIKRLDLLDVQRSVR
jgi:hypothetical protein